RRRDLEQLMQSGDDHVRVLAREEWRQTRQEFALGNAGIELEKLGHVVLGTLVLEGELHEAGGYPRRHVEKAVERGIGPIVVRHDVYHMDRRSVGCDS